MKDKTMNNWFWYAVGAAVLYGLHQVFTKLAADKISDASAASSWKRPPL